MKDNTLARLGGTCSILVGISYVVFAIAFLIAPEKATSDAALFLSDLAQNPTYFIGRSLATALGAVLAFAAVMAISDTIHSANEGWVRWTSVIALVGFAVSAISNFRNLSALPAQAAIYMKGDTATRAAIVAVFPLRNLDPLGVLSFAGVGLWIFVINLLALRAGVWPRTLAYLGIAVAVVTGLLVVGNSVQSTALNGIVGGLGVVSLVLGPIWYIWLGLRLRQVS